MFDLTWPSEDAWLEVGPEGRARILREANRHIPEFPFDPEKIQIYAALLEFYGNEFILTRFTGPTIKEEKQVARAYALVGSRDVYPLDWSKTPIDRVNALTGINLTTWREVWDYLHFYLVFASDHDLLVETKDDLSKVWKRDVDQNTKDRICVSLQPFATPTGLPGMPTVGVGNPFSQSDTVDFEATLATEGMLYRATIQITSAGVVTFDEARTTILEKELPVSVQKAYKANGFTTMLRVTPVPWIEKWDPVSADERRNVISYLHDLRSSIVVYDLKELTVRRASLPFYKNAFLYELLAPVRSNKPISVRTWDGFRRSYLLSGQGSSGEVLFFPLDWTLNPIHEVNEKLGIQLNDQRNIGAYVRFFNWAIRGDEGRSLVIDDLNDIPFNVARTQQHREIEEKIIALRDELTDLNKKPETELDKESKQKLDLLKRYFEQHAVGIERVFYGNTLLLVEFLTSTDGGLKLGKLEIIEELKRWNAESPVLPDESNSAKDDSVFIFQPRKRPDHYLAECCDTGKGGVRQIIKRGSFEDWINTASPIGGKLVIENQVIENDVNIPSGFKLDKSLVIRNVTFKGKLSLRNAQFKSNIEIYCCRLERGLSLKNTACLGSVVVFDTDVLAVRPEEIAVDLDRVNIKGHLDFRLNRVIGRFHAPHVHIDGDARLSGIRVQAVEDAFPEEIIKRTPLFPQERREFKVVFPGGAAQGKYHLPDNAAAIALHHGHIGGELNIDTLFSEDSQGARSDIVVARPVVCGSINGKGICVRGNVSLRGAVCLGNVDFTGSEVGGSVDATIVEDDNSHHGLLVDNNQLHDSDALNLYDAKIGGNLILAGAYLGGNADLMFSRIDGMFGARGYSPRVEGELLLSAAKIGFVEFDGASIRRGVKIVTGEFGRLRFDVGVVMTSSEYARGKSTAKYSLVPCTIGGFSADCITVKSDISLVAARFDVQRTNSAIEEHKITSSADQKLAPFRITHSQIDGNVLLSGDRIAQSSWRGQWQENPAYWMHEDVYWEINGKTLVFDRALKEWLNERWKKENDKKRGALHRGEQIDLWLRFIEEYKNEHADEWDKLLKDLNEGMPENLFRARAASMVLANNRIGGNLVLSHLCVGDRTDRTGRGAPQNELEDNGVLDLTSAEIGGHLRMSRFCESDRNFDKPVYMTRCSQLDMRMVKVGGNADLTGLNVCPVHPSSDVLVNGRHMRIEGDLLFTPKPHGPRQEELIKGKSANITAKDRPGSNKYDKPLLDLSEVSASEMTICGAVLQKGYHSNGKLLDTLKLKEHQKDLLGSFQEYRKHNQKQIIFLTVLLLATLSIRFYWSPAELALPLLFALIVILLPIHAINWVTNHFRAQFTRPTLTLERARFDRLCYLREYPIDADLANIQVMKWEPKEDEMLKVLKNTTPFYRGTYLDVEKALRDKGYESHAKNIFRAMRTRAAREQDLFAWLGSWIVRIFTGYWTRWWQPLAIVGLPLFLLTFYVFDDHKNVSPVTGLLEIQAEDQETVQETVGEKIAQTPNSPGISGKWSKLDALGMTMRYLVPIISLFPAERWIPGRNDLVVELPNCVRHPMKWWDGQASCAEKVSCPWEWITPEIYAMFVSGVMWMVWPVVLITLSGVIRREKQ